MPQNFEEWFKTKFGEQPTVTAEEKALLEEAFDAGLEFGIATVQLEEGEYE